VKQTYSRLVFAPLPVLAVVWLSGKDSRSADLGEVRELYGGLCNKSQPDGCGGDPPCMSNLCWGLGKPVEMGFVLGKPDQCSTDGSSDCGTVHDLHNCTNPGG